MLFSNNIMREFPVGDNALLIHGPAGLIEVITTCPQKLSAPVIGVICHPHPLHGGTMHNKVVHTVAKAFRDMGIVAVRFNFRGVGASAGQFDQGLGETDDLLAVLKWVTAIYPEHSIWLAGFSFGAYVAMCAANSWPVAQLVTIAPPIERFDVVNLPRPNCPWLVVQGDQDEVVAAEKVFAWLESIMPAPELIRMEGAGHFFHGRLLDLRDRLQSILAKRLP